MTLADDVRAVAELRRKATPWRRFVEWGKRDAGYGTATIAPAEVAFIAAAANLDWDALAAAVERGEAWQEAVLEGIDDEVREAVREADANDCPSADCIADAVYEIVRVRLRDAALTAKLKEQP